MIPISSNARIWTATGYTDMRKGMQGLSLLVQESLGRVVSRIFRTFIMRRLRFQIAAVDRVAAYSCSIWPTTLFRRCAVVALPPG